ncbi:DUF3306 domain-containing protein [Aliivibrio fischeri]|uniref:DUF3306 domain-containing protein n=1 Tax=Aliivibrio fischeri TaxID=668 RepID=UPI00132C79FA|nr:DUF3306 domain-containing protein [Aliivibrio fischeri]MUL20381.1 DUF3306 domain-containing protein [Aliivibrio fischeri]MUL24156.1 DUF3306 domain-containing protein [Aliivibrio fischeri]
MSNFLSRWSLRKQKVKQGEEVSDEPVLTTESDTIEDSQVLVEPSVAVEKESETEIEPELPTEADLVTITGTSNVSQFMAEGVDKNLKKAALRKMFLNPEFAMEDEPNYSTPPKLDSETASKLREWLVEPEEEKEEISDEEIALDTDAINENDNEYQYVNSDDIDSSETKKTI